MFDFLCCFCWPKTKKGVINKTKEPEYRPLQSFLEGEDSFSVYENKFVQPSYNHGRALLEEIKPGHLLYGFRRNIPKVERHLQAQFNNNGRQLVYFTIAGIQELLGFGPEYTKAIWKIAAAEILEDKRLETGFCIHPDSLQLITELLRHAITLSHTKTTYHKRPPTIGNLLQDDVSYICKLGIDYVINSTNDDIKLHFITQSSWEGYPDLCEVAAKKYDSKRYTEREMRALFRWFLIKPAVVNARVLLWQSLNKVQTPIEIFTKYDWPKYSVSIYNKYCQLLNRGRGVSINSIKMNSISAIMKWYEKVGELRQEYIKNNVYILNKSCDVIAQPKNVVKQALGQVFGSK